MGSITLCSGGIRAAKYDVVVTMDDDLQHPPEEISRLLTRLVDGVDVVLWDAQGRTTRRAARSCVSHHPTGLSMAIGKELSKNVSAFRVFRTRLREAFANNAARIDMIALNGESLAQVSNIDGNE